jgi:serine/threonine-protein kinase SRPK3
LKAQAKKKKFLKRVEKIKKEEDSDGEISSDDEDEVSENFIGKLLNDKYLVIKYLSRGTFCKVWLVFDIMENKYYALKIQEDEDRETLDNEVKMLSLLKESDRVCKMIDHFEIKFDGRIRKAILLELLGNSIGYLTYEENDEFVNLDMIRQISKKLLLGINDIHNKNLVHCDLKLDNILFTESNSQIKNILKEIDNLELNQSYNTILEQTVNSKLVGLNKSKRKTMKKKIKKKILKELSIQNRDKIIEINDKQKSLNVEKELEVNIEDIPEAKQEEKYKLNISKDNINIKILDLGNTEIVNYNNDDEIYTRCYRPPENIINGTYNTKADIWVIGCIIYELIVGDTIFDFSDCDKVEIDKDRFHVAQMYSILGKMPKKLALDSAYAENYFDLKGRILRYKDIEERDLKEELTNRLKIGENELEIIEDFLKKMLEYNENIRLSAEELLNHEWLRENIKMEIK